MLKEQREHANELLEPFRKQTVARFLGGKKKTELQEQAFWDLIYAGQPHFTHQQARAIQANCEAERRATVGDLIDGGWLPAVRRVRS